MWHLFRITLRNLVFFFLFFFPQSIDSESKDTYMIINQLSKKNLIYQYYITYIFMAHPFISFMLFLKCFISKEMSVTTLIIIKSLKKLRRPFNGVFMAWNKYFCFITRDKIHFDERQHRLGAFSVKEKCRTVAISGHVNGRLWQRGSKERGLTAMAWRVERSKKGPQDRKNLVIASSSLSLFLSLSFFFSRLGCLL